MSVSGWRWLCVFTREIRCSLCLFDYMHSCTYTSMFQVSCVLTAHTCTSMGQILRRLSQNEIIWASFVKAFLIHAYVRTYMRTLPIYTCICKYIQSTLQKMECAPTCWCKYCCHCFVLPQGGKTCLDKARDKPSNFFRTRVPGKLTKVEQYLVEQLEQVEEASSSTKP